MPSDVKFVIFSGAGGGLVSWAFTLMTGATFGLGPWLALPLCVILGGAAALLAVYVITPTDTSKTRQLIGYAVLCGFLWKPVLDAGRVLIGERLETSRTAAGVKENVAELKTSTSATEVAASADKAADGAAALLRSSETLDNPAVEKQATEGATAAVTAIAETSTANPDAATLALQEIQVAAVKAKNDKVARFAAAALSRVRPREATPVTATAPQ